MKRSIITALLGLILAVTFCLTACGSQSDAPIPIKVLILPKFQVSSHEDKISGDFPGEGQYYFKEYMKDADTYKIPGGHEGSKMYVKDGIAYYVLGEGKINAALSTDAVLDDKRFDFSDAYILSIGCAGSARDTTVMGDVFLITAAIDYDAGHHADIREMENKDREIWFHDEALKKGRYLEMDHKLMDKVYGMIKDVPLKTTAKTRRYMSKSFKGAKWALRDPKVLRGTTVTGDNYWKGKHDHDNALLMVKTYRAPDPFVTTEMEDLAVAQAVKRAGMLDRLITLRSSVNMDVFMNGNTPESLWDPEHSKFNEEDRSEETSDVFPTAMKNNFKAGKVIIDAIMKGKF